MDSSFSTSATHEHRKGRSFLWAGIILCVLALLLCMVQFGLLKYLEDPWYVPMLTTLGVLLVLGSAMKRLTLVRIGVLILLAGLALFEWYFLIVLARLPEYKGPAQTGTTVPAFQTRLADGRSFTEKDLQDGRETALVFFRGRW